MKYMFLKSVMLTILKSSNFAYTFVIKISVQSGNCSCPDCFYMVPKCVGEGKKLHFL